MSVSDWILQYFLFSNFILILFVISCLVVLLTHDATQNLTLTFFLYLSFNKKYGYYFFLGKPVDAQLYAQTSTSAQTVPLLLRRADLTDLMASKNQREFFPLSGVSYVVIRVTSVPYSTPTSDKSNISSYGPNGDAVRLQYILGLNSMLHSFA